MTVSLKGRSHPLHNENRFDISSLFVPGRTSGRDILLGFLINQTLESLIIPNLGEMSYRREHRGSRSALFDDGLEEGGLRASSSLSRDISEQDNDRTIESLQDRAIFLKKLTGDIHEEVESHNLMLDRMGNKMDMSRGTMIGTMDRFKMVFEKKSGRRTCALVGAFVISFLILYYLIKWLI